MAMEIYRLNDTPLSFFQDATEIDAYSCRQGRGIGIIILAQRTFNSVFITCSLVISSQLFVQISKLPDTFNMVKMVLTGFIILCLMLLVVPLAFFSPKLVITKQLGLLHLSNLGVDLSRTFEKEWLNTIPIENRIEDKHVDPSMAFDYAGMYDLLEQLRVISVTIRDIIGMVVMLIIPFIPILLIYFSAAEILQKIIGLLM